MPSNPAYNEICYINRYPDVKNGYIFQGSDGNWAYQQNLIKGFLLQKKKLSENAFWHWQNFGMSEGRVCGCDLPETIYSAEFDGDAYNARYPDVRLSPTYKGNPLGHYQTYGMIEGRHPGYEILTANSPVGMVSPGTTTQGQDNTDLNQGPGDGSVILNPNDVSLNPTDVIAPPAQNDIGTWIAANPWLFAGAVGAVLLIAKKSKKKKKFSRV